MRVFKDWPPDLVVTDLMMPGMSGVEVCRAIRAQSAVPILVLSVRDHERSKVEALDAGRRRLRDQALQHSGAAGPGPRPLAPRSGAAPSMRIEVGDFVVDAAAHIPSTVLGKPIHLTPKEFDLLLHLARHAGKVMTHRALLTTVWGAPVGPPAGVSARLRRPVAQEARSRDRQAVHPDRALGRLPLRPRGLDRQRRIKSNKSIVNK